MRTWTELIWHKTVSSGRPLRMWYWNFRFYIRQEISLLAEWQLASQEGPCSTACSVNSSTKDHVPNHKQVGGVILAGMYQSTCPSTIFPYKTYQTPEIWLQISDCNSS
jgi:hypothetical protein